MRTSLFSTLTIISTLISSVVFSVCAKAADIDAAEIYCTIREAGSRLNCQWVGKEQRRALTPEEVTQFIDKAAVAAYLSVRSHKGMERVFLVDADAPQFRKLYEVQKSGSISEIAKAKLDLFAEIEKRAIKISDDLDAISETAELVKYDGSIGVDKYKRELHRLDDELLTFKGTGAENTAYESGPRAVDPGMTEIVDASRFAVMIGEGVSSQSISAGQTISPTIGTYNFVARFNWNAHWSNEIEGIFGQQTTLNYAAGKVSNPTPSNYTLKTAYWWKSWGAEIDVAQYNYLALESNSVTTAQRFFDVYSDLFYGASVVYRARYGNNIVYGRLGYLIGSATNTIDGKSPNSEGLIKFSVNLERQIVTHHGVGVQLHYESVSDTMPSATVNNPPGSITSSNFALNAFYKYAF